MTSATPIISTPTTADAATEANREAAIDFMTTAARGQAREAMQEYAAPDFVHHNPYFAGDATSLARAMDENARANPEKRFEVLRTIAEGPLVALHGRVQHKPGAPVSALVHLFRFTEGRISEMWDVGQEVPADSPNDRGMF